MSLIFFDSETTGVPDWESPSHAEHQPHIVELAGVKTTDDGEIEDTFSVLVQPDGWTIPPEITQIHGITQEYAMDLGLPEKMAVEAFLAFWGGHMRIAHSANFDNRIVRIATKRFCDNHAQKSWQNGLYQCTMRMAAPTMRSALPHIRKGMPSLADAYSHFTGKEIENAHRAMPDAMACKELYFAIKLGATC